MLVTVIFVFIIPVVSLADISTALNLLEKVQKRMEDCDDPKLQLHTSQDLKSLISLLEDPIFRSIVTIQDSLLELNTQLGQHPSILPGDFDINISGQLELSVPNTPVQPLGPNMYQDLYQDSSELEDQRVPVAPLLHGSSSEDTSVQVTSHYRWSLRTVFLHNSGSYRNFFTGY